MKSMPKISATKNNDYLSLVLGGKHYNFTGDKADDVFELAMEYKKNQNEDNLEALNKGIAKLNVVLHEGLVEETGNGEYYLKGYRDCPMPTELAEHLIEYAEKDYPTEALINFWKLCMANPNKKARDDFFKYVKEYGVTITDKGYVILYKSVARKEEADDELVSFISQQYQKVKRQKKAPSNYAVVKVEDTLEEGEDSPHKYELVNCYNATTPDNPEDVEGVIDDLQHLHDNLDDLIEKTDAHYVPHHSGGDYGNKIQLGEPVPMPREKCDPNINKSCSVGLHVGHRSYVKGFSFSSKKLILACLVNPMNVVALPKHDHSKMRTCEYFPYAVMAIGGEEWEEIEGEYFEEDYCNYEEENLEKILETQFTEEDVDDVDEYKERLVNIYN